MRLSTGPSARPSVQAGIKLAKLLELPEKAVEDKLRALEGDPLFKRLAAAGAVALESDGAARFASRRTGGYGLRTSTQGIPELLDGRGDLAVLIERVGQERFTECFLSDEEGLDDHERAKRCGLSPEDVRRLRALVDRLYVQAEFEAPAPAEAASAAPPLVCSAVAGIGVENGRPYLAFFHRDVWKGRWQVNDAKRRLLEAAMPAKDRRRLDALLREIEQLERRKSTLLKVLETVIESQAAFLVSRDPAKRAALTQRDLSARVGADPSVINRLIANKSVELPWGLEAPLRAFVPSPKTILRERLQELAAASPDASDEALRAQLLKRYGAKLSRRSVTQYRKELRLGRAGRRETD